jgi:hypothetical protein
MATYDLIISQSAYLVTGRDLTVSDGGPYGNGGGKGSHQQAEAEWEARNKWKKIAQDYDFEAKPEPKPKVEIEDVLPRLSAPTVTLPELIADAEVFNIGELQALYDAIAARDAELLAEMAYLTELAVQQEKDAIAAFLMFMD